ncbi:ribosome maturation protein [Gautieria morchelliformis]|nr:ribosome maturation protein [Gautieria morchelliformis]
MSAPQLRKLIYKPDTQSTDEFILMVNLEEYHKYKDGDTTVPLAQVVGSFDVFHSGQGNQGKLGKASKQQLENIFETSREDDVVKFMLEKGTVQGGIEISGGGMDKSRFGQLIDTRGSGGGLRGHSGK